MITLSNKVPEPQESEQVSHESFRESLNDNKESMHESKSFINRQNKSDCSVIKSDDESFMQLNNVEGVHF